MKLFELTDNTQIKYGRTLIQIRAVVDFNDVKTGDLGGWIEDENSIDDGCWVYPDAMVFKPARLYGGEMRGGEMLGGVMWGGVRYGGVMRGGVMLGGVVYDGEIWGGVMLGGVMWGGVMHGGVACGGEINRDDHNEYAKFYNTIRPVREMKLEKFTQR